MTTVQDTAAYFIWLANEDGNLITHLKLQRLCYYAQGYALAFLNKPMFPEPIEAWEHGPIVRQLYDEYEQYRRTSIPAPLEAPEMEPWRQRILEMVNTRFGWMSIWELRNRTHAEVPWLEAWNKDDSDPVLSNHSMKLFFRTLIDGQRPRPMPIPAAEIMELLKDNDALREATARGRADLRAGLKVSWVGSDGDAV